MIALVKKARARLQVLTALCASVFALTGVAHAVSSGVVYHWDAQTPAGCRGFYMNSHMDKAPPGWTVSMGEVGTKLCYPNAPDVDSPTGALQVWVDGFANGTLCGSTPTSVNSSPAYRLWVSAQLCSKSIWSVKQYMTVTWGALNDGITGWRYDSQQSPNLIY